MKKKRGMEEDDIRFLTINTKTGNVNKHLSLGHGLNKRMFVDILFFRFCVPGDDKFDVKCLGVRWRNCSGNDENPKFVVYNKSTNEFRFFDETWGNHFVGQYDSGEPEMFLINIQDSTYYVGGGKWKKI